MFPQENIGEAVDALTSLLSVVEALTSALSGISAVPLLTGGMLGGGIIALVKNLD